MKYKKPFWLVGAVLGAAAAAAALGVLILRAVSGQLDWIGGAILAAAILGGCLTAAVALRALRLLPGAAEGADAKPTDRHTAALPAVPAERLDRKCSFVLSALILLLCAAIFLGFYEQARLAPSIPQSTVQTGIVYAKAKVLAIDDEEWRGSQVIEDVPVGSQTVTVEILEGQFRGRREQIKNEFSYLYGSVLKVGDPVTVAFSLTDGNIDNIVMQDYDRTLPMILVVLGFLLITVLVGGKVGAKSLLGLALTILCIFAVLIPLLLDGWPTLPTILGMCAFVTVVEFVILGGVNRKTVCAILGTIAGVIFAALLGELACALLRVDGFKLYSAEPTVEALLNIKQGQASLRSIQIGDLLVGGILIAALGAVNDVAMSISSAMNELIAVNPNLTRKELFRSGMNIGRDMVGTMTNTLILAFVGSGLVLMIFLVSLEPSFQQLISSAYFSVEIVQALASSLGVILAVPLSVVFGMVLFGRPKKK